MVASCLAVIIPALNETKTIGLVLERVRQHGQAIVVDDGSTDGTADLARSLGVEVVVHARNLGYDGALNSGFQHAEKLGFPHAVTIDADGQLPADLIPEFARHLDAGADLVVGIRDLVPRISEFAFKIMARRLYGLDDPLCGMKGYKMSFFRELGHFDSYGSIGTELMLHIVRRKGRIAQVPVATKPRTEGEARIGRAFRANYIIGRAAAIALVHHVTR